MAQSTRSSGVCCKYREEESVNYEGAPPKGILTEEKVIMGTSTMLIIKTFRSRPVSVAMEPRRGRVDSKCSIDQT